MSTPGTASNSEARKRANEIAEGLLARGLRGSCCINVNTPGHQCASPFGRTPMQDPADVDRARAHELADLRGEVARLQGLLDARPAPVGVTLTDAEPEYVLVQPGLGGVAWLGEVIDGEPSPIGTVADLLAARQAPTVALDVETVAKAYHEGLGDAAWATVSERVRERGLRRAAAVVAADPRRTVAAVQAETLSEAANDVPWYDPQIADEVIGWLTERADRIGGDQ